MRKLLLLAMLCTPVAARAEMWPSLEQYVGMCAAIVKAKTVVVSGGTCEFEITEVWAGSTADLEVNERGHYVAYQGEHGIKVEPGQEIVFFFGWHNQRKDKIRTHGTSFPIKDGRLIYGATSEDYYREYAVDAFRDEILCIIAAARRTNP